MDIVINQQKNIMPNSKYTNIFTGIFSKISVMDIYSIFLFVIIGQILGLINVFFFF